MNLAFFSGNEVFWKTRWEDGGRTLVTYKETHANAKIDPQLTTWTGTWRDPRFSPPADGGKPENALTGQLFSVNAGATTAIRVPAADGKMRFWRNTTIATQAAGATATLPDGTLGYEWDVDPDNGFRPAGAFRLSATSVANAPGLVDYGSTFSPQTIEHNMTLYRAASGARVFGAGTVQWAWGLDASHDRGSAAADVRMQQATLNLLADMGAQPSTLQSGLVAATASADATRPTSTITAPANNGTVQPNSTVTISGTAADTGGGVVGGVEVSTDGGETWHRANGRAAWTYSWNVGSGGTYNLRSRAVDDSGNLETVGAGITVTAGSGSATCPCTIWGTGATPDKPAETTDTVAVEVGAKFRTTTAGKVAGVRFYKGATNTGTHVGHLWSRDGHAARARPRSPTRRRRAGSRSRFATPDRRRREHDLRRLLPRPERQLREQRRLLRGRRRRQRPAARAARRRGRRQRRLRLRRERHRSRTRPGARRTTGSTCCLRDGRRSPPTRRRRPSPSVTPARGATGVATGVNATARFSEPMTASTVNATTVTCATRRRTAVPASVSYDAATPDRHARPDRGAGRLDHVHRDGQGRERRREGRSPATRSRPTTPGRSRRAR